MSYQVSYVQTNPDVSEQLDQFLNNGLTIPTRTTTYLNPLQGYYNDYNNNNYYQQLINNAIMTNSSTVLPATTGATMISAQQPLVDFMQASAAPTVTRVVQNEPLILPQTESYEIIQPQQTQTLIEASAPALLQPQTLLQSQLQPQTQLIQYPNYINLNNARYKLVSRTQQLYVDTPAGPAATTAAFPNLMTSSGLPTNALRFSAANQLVLPRIDGGAGAIRAPTTYYTMPSFGATRQMAMSTPALPTVSRRVVLSSLGQPLGTTAATSGAPVIYRL